MRKITALILFAIIASLNIKAQNFTNEPILQNRPPEKKVTFWDVQKAFECYWDSLEPSNVESENAEEGGWQQYKRWEWFVKQRTFPGG